MTPVDIYSVGVLCQNFVYFHELMDSSISGGLILLNLFYCLKGNYNNIFVPRDTKAYWFNPQQFILAVYKVILSRESTQGALSPIGLIPSHFYFSQGSNIKRVCPRGTKAHWVNT